jgi:molecular chaperone GrpE
MWDAPYRIPVTREAEVRAAHPETATAPEPQPRVDEAHTVAIEEPQVESGPVVEEAQESASSQDEVREETTWKIKAIQLQAEMDNFRKRQQRRADEAIAQGRERLLKVMLPVADNLTRALAQSPQSDGPLQKGVELTYRELMRRLENEGVTRFETTGQPFNPQWHEAVALVEGQAEPDTILQEVEAGYRLGDKLLRPAKVVVAA